LTRTGYIPILRIINQFPVFQETDIINRGVTIMRNVIIFTSLIACVTLCYAKGENNMTAKTPGSASSAWETGTHVNGFVKAGIAKEKDVNKKIAEVYQQLFFGDASNERLCYETSKKDMAFINAIDSKDIRSEGMSYGMIIAVMMNDQTVFNKLWKFAKTKMQHQSGDRKGYFAWHLSNEAPYPVLDQNPAPDGEEYFVMALFFAKNRWGNGTGIFNYENEANEILHEMIHKKPNGNQLPMMNPKYTQIVFSPDPTCEAEFTDPSYHLPAFYELWALWAKSDKEYWSKAADVSRNFFQTSSHPVTGLFPDYAAFTGEPQETTFNSNSHLSAFDSFRVIQNIAVDYLWFGKDNREIELVNRLLKFYAKEGNYVSVYTLDGKAQVTYRSEGLVAMNAVGAMISDNPDSKQFIAALWNQPTPTGQWRYYNGLLHLMGLLHVSGNFKIYGNPKLKDKYPL
jgi:oligosaccharide reducing-end xylanase